MPARDAVAEEARKPKPRVPFDVEEPPLRSVLAGAEPVGDGGLDVGLETVLTPPLASRSLVVWEKQKHTGVGLSRARWATRVRDAWLQAPLTSVEELHRLGPNGWLPLGRATPSTISPHRKHSWIPPAKWTRWIGR